MKPPEGVSGDGVEKTMTDIWCIKIEGRCLDPKPPQPRYEGHETGFFTTCAVKSATIEDARTVMLAALAADQLALVEVIKFARASNVDFSDQEWPAGLRAVIVECRRTGETCFETFHCFPIGVP